MVRQDMKDVVNPDFVIKIRLSQNTKISICGIVGFILILGLQILISSAYIIPILLIGIIYGISGFVWVTTLD